jgi:ribosomal protein S27E
MVTDFKYGDLVIKCHQCGNEELIEELVTDGRAIYLFNNNDSFLKLHCTKCDITMEMTLRPSTNPPDEDILIDEELQEEITQEEDL